MTQEEVGGDFHKPMVGRGVVLADFDLDGDLDVLVGACGESPRLLENAQETGNSWVSFQLEGAKSNRDAVGAVVEVQADKSTQ